ncbi:MAG: hypothetical protein GQ570_02840 [Helicobacteraceae bacterium]|nr:hypothetical protein [Helicobacteraceae bacterium]
MQKYLGLSAKTFFISLFIVIVFSLYLDTLLFGNYSLEVLLNLMEYETFLKEEIYELKHENAALQKEYFELKELESE